MSPRRQAPAEGSGARVVPPVRMQAGLPEKRQAIIDAARSVFLRNGFTDASVDTIATEAGVSKQTIYNHFGDKSRLFKAVIAATQNVAAEDSVAGLLRALAESDDLERDLRVMGRGMVRGVLREDIAAMRRLIIAEWARHPELLDEWAGNRQMFEHAFIHVVERQAERGVLDVPDAALAARQLMTLVTTEALTRSLYGIRELTDAVVAEIVDNGVAIWLRAYRSR